MREALPRILLMPKSELVRYMAENPTGAEILAYKFVQDVPAKAIERFLGKMPQPLTGADGAPLIPETTAAVLPVIPALDFTKWTPAQVDLFIQATAASAVAKKGG